MRLMKSLAELSPVLEPSLILSFSHCYLPQPPSGISSCRRLPSRLLPAQL